MWAGTGPKTGQAGFRRLAKIGVAVGLAEGREEGKKGLIRSKDHREVIERSSNSLRNNTVAHPLHPAYLPLATRLY